MTEGYWTSSDFDVLCLRFLDWLAERQGPSRLVDAGAFREVEPDIDDDTVRDIVTHHQTRGHLGVTRSFSGHASVRVNREGLADLRRRSERRQDLRLRAMACRDALLDWLYVLDSQGADPRPSVESVRGQPWSFFEGDPFTDEELQRAAVYLRDRGLIDGVPVAERDDPLRPMITTDGRACVERFDSVASWEDRERGGTQVVTHFNAPVHGQVGIGGGDVHQSQQQGIDGETLQRLLDDVRSAAEVVEPAEAAYLRTYLDTIQAEAQAEQPDRAVIEGTCKRLREIAGRVGNPALTTTVVVLVTNLLKALGIS